MLNNMTAKTGSTETNFILRVHIAVLGVVDGTVSNYTIFRANVIVSIFKCLLT